MGPGRSRPRLTLKASPRTSAIIAARQLTSKLILTPLTTGSTSIGLAITAATGRGKLATLLQTTASVQPPPIVDSSIGLVDAGNWTSRPFGKSLAAAVSGVYIAHLVRQDGTSGENHIPFIVRDDGGLHDIVFQTSDTTWHAYNGWGGYSLYGGGASGSSDGRAYKVSYNRPYRYPRQRRHLRRSAGFPFWGRDSRYSLAGGQRL